uniref:Ubiquitin-like domain-containing protein n=1 Tax=Caenorhabditis tropicalis TaxID=1561998 RepID=A0A1I7TGL9_9PELO
MSESDVLATLQKLSQEQKVAQKYVFQMIEALRDEFTMKLDAIQELLEKISTDEMMIDDSEDGRTPEPTSDQEMSRVKSEEPSFIERRPTEQLKTELVQQMGQYDDYRQSVSKFDSTWRVMLPDGTCEECEMPDDSTVNDVKKRIEELRKVPVHQQTFLIRGREHKDEEKLHALMVTINQTICRIYYRR